MNDGPLRIGLVGLGYWGPNLARNFAAIGGVSLPGAATHPRRQEPGWPRSFPAPG